MLTVPFAFAVLIVGSNCYNYGSGRSRNDYYGGGGGGRSGHRPRYEPRNGGCREGWRRFNRPSGGWCLGVVSAEGAIRDQAARACANQGAILSGIQNPTEMTWIHQTANRRKNMGSLWIGARRTSACLGKKLNQPASCSKTTSFGWTDNGATSGTAGFSWLDGSQPDNALGGHQNCMLLFFAARNTTINNVNWYPGALDDVNCDDRGANAQRRVRGGVCGMRPSR